MCEASKAWAVDSCGMDAPAAEAFSKQYDMDDEMYLDDNSCECETYHVGDNRCSCGNRRVYVEVSEQMNGDFIFSTNVN